MPNSLQKNPSLPVLADSTSFPVPFHPNERLFTAKEVAAQLGVSERWVRDHATRRYPRIRAIKLGPLVRFRWTDVQLFLDELSIHPDAKHR